MQNPRKASLIEGDYRKQIFNMSLGMIIGMLGMTIFNIVDTIYVGRLGKEELAALSFTFPVVMVVQSLSLGLGMGLSAVLSTTLGEKRFDKAARVTTHGIILALLIVAIVSTAGRLSIRPLFTFIGASGIVLDYIDSYMSVWFFTAVMVVVPMVGNNAIRATGDTKTPSLVMLISATVNSILDPLFIFGIGPFPEMGVQGAAVATALARSIGMASALTILARREKLLTLDLGPFREVLQSWKAILHIGIPTALVRMITPLATGVITGLLARFGTAAVAGYGAGVKAEGFAMAFTLAVGASVGPFIGQNRGAGRQDRVLKGAGFANKLAFLSGTGVFIILFILAGPLSTLFSPVEEVRHVMKFYMRIAGLGYGMQGVFTNSGTIYNVMKKPLYSAGLSLLQMFVLYLPAAHIASGLFGEPGIFASQALSYILAGFISLTILNRLLHRNNQVSVEIDETEIVKQGDDGIESR